MRLRHATAFASVLLLAAGLATAAPPGPDSHRDPLLDGCQRSQALTLAAATPEWVYVGGRDVLAARLRSNPLAGRRTLVGTVAWSRPPGEDLYISHDYNDYNFAVKPDPAYDDLLASGNRASGGNEKDTLEVEWEATKLPAWVWPSAGDRTLVRGAWIWDCGHWGDGGIDDTHGISPLLPYDPEETVKDLAGAGSLRGETTEIHPPDLVAVVRKTAAVLHGRPQAVAHLDAWVNGDGAAAASLEDCALLGIVVHFTARATCPATHDVGGDYVLTVPVGPRPRGGRLLVGGLLVRPETDPGLRTVPVRIDPDESRGVVTVSFQLPHSPSGGRYGISLDAGWSTAPRAVRHHVVVDAVRVVHDLDGASEPNNNPFGADGEQAPSPGEWVLHASVNGHWAPLVIGSVHDGQVITRPLVMDVWLPAGVAPRLFVGGRECDEPLMDCTTERYGAALPTPLPAGELGFNDHPGRIQESGFTNLGVVLRPGRHDYAPLSAKPGQAAEDLSDDTCAGPCYTVTVTLT